MLAVNMDAILAALAFAAAALRADLAYERRPARASLEDGTLIEVYVCCAAVQDVGGDN